MNHKTLILNLKSKPQTPTLKQGAQMAPTSAAPGSRNPSTLHLKPSTLNPQPSTLNPQPSTLNPQPSTLNPQQPQPLNPQPSTLNPQPSTLIPQPSTPNPGERLLCGQPTGPNPLHHRDDLVDRPRALKFEFPFPGSLTSTLVAFLLLLLSANQLRKWLQRLPRPDSVPPQPYTPKPQP